RRERLLSDDDLLLLLRLRDAHPRCADHLRQAIARDGRRADAAGTDDAAQPSSRVKVVVLTTSYPRSPEDVVGRFIADAVERLRRAGVTVEVVSPLSFHHFGIAYGHGVVGNLRRRPWLALFVPAMLASFSRAARRAARDADLVHAHWLPAGLVARTTGKPFVVQLWGTDVELAHKASGLARSILRRARLAICASEELATAARELGARAVRVI